MSEQSRRLRGLSNIKLKEELAWKSENGDTLPKGYLALVEKEIKRRENKRSKYGNKD